MDSRPLVVPATTGGKSLPLIALFTANAISMVGNALAAISIPWFVLQTTGSAAQTGIAGFFTILPVVLAAFFGGSLVDRLGYKRASILADITSGIAIALIPLAYHTVGLAFWQLLILVFIGNLLDAPGSTARAALVPELAERAGVTLERAASSTQVIERGSRLIGAPLAGLLIAFINPSDVLWIDAATFLLSALLVRVLVPLLTIKSSAPPTGSYLANVTDGLRFIRRDRVILALVLTVMVTNMLDAPWGSVVMPVYAKDHFGSAMDLGLMIAVFGGGSVIGAMLFAAMGHRLPRRKTFTILFIILSLRFWVLAAFPFFWAVLATMIIVGLASGPLNPIMSTIEYERIPANMRGRVFGAITAGCYLGMPLGVLIGGFALERIGITGMLALLGIIYLATTASLLVNPALREMDRPVTAWAERGLTL